MFIALLSLLGGFINRWHGGGFFTAPRWVKQTIWALPFILTAWPHMLFVGPAFIMCFAGIATGHGRGQSLKEPLTGMPEKIEILTLWAQPHLSVYWYKVLILSVCGIAMASGGIIGLLFTGHILGALILLIAGAISPIAYMLGWAIHPKEIGKGWWFFNTATQIGEWGTGVICYAGLAIALWEIK